VEVRDRAFKLIGQGSGFLVSEDGLVATNHHVIQNAFFAHVAFPDGSKYPVEGVAWSQRSCDLALLKIRGRQFPSLKLAEDALPSVGSKVYAIGNPQGLTNSLSDGLVSGHRQLDDDFTVIQTTAAISPGSSGGPLLSKEGKVVGITTASIQGGQNLNLVVPVRMLKDAIKGQGQLQTLASAGGEPLKADDAEKLDEVWAAIEKEDYGKALKLLAALQESQKGSAAYWFSVGFVQAKLGNHELAIDAWRNVIKIDPSDETSFFNLGYSYQEVGRHRDAIAAYKSALALKPDDTSALFNTGTAHGKLGEYDQAIASFKSVIAIEPDNARAYFFMGLAYSQSNQSDEAVRSFKTAVTLDENNAESYYWMGVELRRLRKYDEAIQACRSAIRLNSDHAAAYTNMGRCYLSLRNNREATRALETAIRIDPKSAGTHLYLGMCYIDANQLTKGSDHLRRAVELDPNGQTGRSAQKILDAGR
jgi:tetratricopeptide (TPR) repeat protein